MLSDTLVAIWIWIILFAILLRTVHQSESLTFMCIGITFALFVYTSSTANRFQQVLSLGWRCIVLLYLFVMIIRWLIDIFNEI